MTATNYGLVVLSAVLLAVANFLVKRSDGSQALVGLSKVSEGVLLLPLLVAGVGVESGSLQSVWPLPLVGAVLLLMINVLLAAASRYPDLSLVIPASRGAMLAALPLAGFLAIGETVDAMGAAGIAVMVVGVASLPLRSFGADGVRAYGRAIPAPATRLSLLAGVVAAGSAIWDKRSVQVLSPLAYLAAYSGVVGLVNALVLRQSGLSAAVLEWRKSWRTILLVAALGSGSSWLALAALQTENASYVIALRQISVAVGAALGARWLGEALAPPAVTGIALVLGGCVLLALAG
jgi:uncharacterized membrane protein